MHARRSGCRVACGAGLLGVWALAVPGARIQAQEAATLTLEEALALARRNNHDYLTQQNDAGVADWAVRAAYGALLPSASASTSLGWQGAGTPRFGIFTGDDVGIGRTTSYYSSSYSLGLNYRLTGSSLLAPSQERASRRATEASIAAAGSTLDAVVTQQYLAVLRAQDGVTLAEQELARAEQNLRYAEARVEVGAAIGLEIKQSQVEVGRARVALLQAENLVQTELLRLMQQLGVTVDRDVRLTTTFAVTEVPWTQEQLVAMALQNNPQLRSALAREDASETSVKMARTAYLPSLSMSAGWSGFARQAADDEFVVEQARDAAAGQVANCEALNELSARLVSPLPGTPANCSVFALTPEQVSRVRAANDVFPFDFTSEPLSLSLSLSLPVFQGFSRERQIEEARALAADALHRVRAEELRLRMEVGTGHQTTVTALQIVALEESNRQLADEQLAMQRERYRVGVATFLELQDAETVKARADRDHLNALYAFHVALSQLEAAVGRSLRPDGSR